MKIVPGLGLCLALATPLAADHRFPSFREGTCGLRLVGNATVAGSAVRLTSSVGFQTGAVWTEQKVSVRRGFDTTFRVRISGTGGIFNTTDQATGADGFAFVIQPESPAALGSLGGYIGYDGIPRSLAIEFDTWANDAANPPDFGDPDGNHVSVHTNGLGPNSALEAYSIARRSLGASLSSGAVRSFRIRYDGDTLTVFSGGVPFLSVAIDIAAVLGLEDGEAHVGFTAATASAYERHDLLGWDFESSSQKIIVGLGSEGTPMHGVAIQRRPGSFASWQYVGLTDPLGRLSVDAWPAGSYEVRAVVNYPDIALGGRRFAINYPMARPGTEIVLPGRSMAIRYPAPVILQAGLDGGAHETWEVAADLLGEDPASRDAAYQDQPGFLVYPVPNQEESFTFGYDNGISRCGLLWQVNVPPSLHDDNARVLHRFIEDGVLASLSCSRGGWIDDSVARFQPVSLLAHSMGGLIARALVVDKASRVSVERVVCLDSPHGGTTIERMLQDLIDDYGAFCAVNLSGFREGELNGYSSEFGVPPVEPGWNARHRDVTHRDSWLLYTCVDDLLVSPDLSALGFGRYVLRSGEPAGIGAQFVLGHDVPVELGHTEIHRDQAVLSGVMQFLGTGRVPREVRKEPSLPR